MNRNLDRAITKTLREINADGAGSASEMIERLAHHYMEIEMFAHRCEREDNQRRLDEMERRRESNA